jgi:hypothetical protein
MIKSYTYAHLCMYLYLCINNLSMIFPGIINKIYGLCDSRTWLAESMGFLSLNLFSCFGCWFSELGSVLGVILEGWFLRVLRFLKLLVDYIVLVLAKGLWVLVVFYFKGPMALSRLLCWNCDSLGLLELLGVDLGNSTVKAE